jgi:hypothetical protein
MDTNEKKATAEEKKRRRGASFRRQGCDPYIGVLQPPFDMTVGPTAI